MSGVPTLSDNDLGTLGAIATVANIIGAEFASWILGYSLFKWLGGVSTSTTMSIKLMGAQKPFFVKGREKLNLESAWSSENHEEYAQQKLKRIAGVGNGKIVDEVRDSYCTLLPYGKEVFIGCDDEGNPVTIGGSTGSKLTVVEQRDSLELKGSWRFTIQNDTLNSKILSESRTYLETVSMTLETIILLPMIIVLIVLIWIRLPDRIQSGEWFAMSSVIMGGLTRWLGWGMLKKEKVTVIQDVSQKYLNKISKPRYFYSEVRWPVVVIMLRSVQEILRQEMSDNTQNNHTKHTIVVYSKEGGIDARVPMDRDDFHYMDSNHCKRTMCLISKMETLITDLNEKSHCQFTERHDKWREALCDLLHKLEERAPNSDQEKILSIASSYGNVAKENMPGRMLLYLSVILTDDDMCNIVTECFRGFNLPLPDDTCNRCSAGMELRDYLLLRVSMIDERRRTIMDCTKMIIKPSRLSYWQQCAGMLIEVLYGSSFLLSVIWSFIILVKAKSKSNKLVVILSIMMHTLALVTAITGTIVRIRSSHLWGMIASSDTVPESITRLLGERTAVMTERTAESIRAVAWILTINCVLPSHWYIISSSSVWILVWVASQCIQDYSARTQNS